MSKVSGKITGWIKIELHIYNIGDISYKMVYKL
jgi:hypothetical protein